MKNEKTLIVKDKEIRVKHFDGLEMFNLTDLVKNFDQSNAATNKVLYRWFKNPDTLEFLAAYEAAFNPNSTIDIEKEFGKKYDGRSVKEFVRVTQTPFMRSESGRYGGTWAVFDIAASCMMWLSAKFKVWFIQDYRLMKESELRAQLTAEEWQTQKKVDGLTEVLRFEKDELKLIQEKRNSLK